MMNLPTAPVYELRVYRTPEDGWKLRILSLTTAVVEPIEGSAMRRVRHPHRHITASPFDEHSRTPYVRHLGTLDEFEIIAFCEKEEILQIKEAVIDLFEKHVDQVLDGLHLPVETAPSTDSGQSEALYEVRIQNDLRGNVVAQRIFSQRIQKRTKYHIFYRTDSGQSHSLKKALLGLPPTWEYGKGVRLTAWTEQSDEVETIRVELLREYEAYKGRMLDEMERAAKDVERLRTEEPSVGIF